MKLKYYLRGLGIGIIVTALLMGYSNSKNGLNQAEARNEYEEMQTEDYVQSTLLADRKTQETENSGKEVETQESDAAAKEEQTQEPDAAAKEEQTQEPDAAAKEEIHKSDNTDKEKIQTQNVEEEETKSTETNAINSKNFANDNSPEEIITSQNDAKEASEKTVRDTVTLKIERGDDSGTVSRKLQNAGIIENASEFDAYLMQHGYDKKISIGTVEIPSDATWPEITDLISGR